MAMAVPAILLLTALSYKYNKELQTTEILEKKKHFDCKRYKTRIDGLLSHGVFLSAQLESRMTRVLVQWLVVRFLSF